MGDGAAQVNPMIAKEYVIDHFAGALVEEIHQGRWSYVSYDFGSVAVARMHVGMVAS